jgi:competence protein ComEC
LAVAGPDLAVISVGENTYGHPAQETLDRLVQVMDSEFVFRTDEDGTIEFISDGSSLWLKLE